MRNRALLVCTALLSTSSSVSFAQDEEARDTSTAEDLTPQQTRVIETVDNLNQMAAVLDEEGALTDEQKNTVEEFCAYLEENGIYEADNDLGFNYRGAGKGFEFNIGLSAPKSLPHWSPLDS